MIYDVLPQFTKKKFEFENIGEGSGIIKTVSVMPKKMQLLTLKILSTTY